MSENETENEALDEPEDEPQTEPEPREPWSEPLYGPGSELRDGSEDVPRPGDKLFELLDERHISQAELCARTGRTPKAINEIVKGKAPISPETAFLLEMALHGKPASYWIGLETEYQDHLIRRRHTRHLEANLDWLNELPLRAMIKAKWARKLDDPLDQARYLLRWFGVATPERWRKVYLEPQAGYRSSPPIDRHPGSLAAWMRAGELQAEGMDTAPYDRKRFRAALEKLRLQTRTWNPATYQDAMIEHCIASGVALAWAREMPGLKVAGASRWLSPTKALIQLSLYHRTDTALWYTFFHQAAHILLHGRKQVFLDGRFDGKPNRDDVLEEVEADHFAANFLVPMKELERLRPLCDERKLSRRAVKEFAAEIGVSAGIVVTRLQLLGWIPPRKFNTMKTLLSWAPPGTYVDI